MGGSPAKVREGFRQAQDRLHWPWAADLPFRFRVNTETENAHEKLAAFKAAYDMGLKLKAQDVYDLIGASKPSQYDETLAGPAPGGSAPPPAGTRAEPYTRYREEEHPRDDKTGRFINKPSKAAEADAAKQAGSQNPAAIQTFKA